MELPDLITKIKNKYEAVELDKPPKYKLAYIVAYILRELTPATLLRLLNEMYWTDNFDFNQRNVGLFYGNSFRLQLAACLGEYIEQRLQKEYDL